MLGRHPGGCGGVPPRKDGLHRPLYPHRQHLPQRMRSRVPWFRSDRLPDKPRLRWPLSGGALLPHKDHYERYAMRTLAPRPEMEPCAHAGFPSPFRALSRARHHESACLTPSRAIVRVGLWQPAGTYCPNGTTTPFPCPEGTFSESPELDSVDGCSDCTAGNTCPLGTSTPIPCPNGEFCPPRSVRGISCQSILVGESLALGFISPWRSPSRVGPLALALALAQTLPSHRPCPNPRPE